ncbi:hypothetical protein [Haliangium ochraceum]|uniref:Uncharacterized protein n=1 Tax=Haliangium ochraceum (strain DSM 14365 / JCM 11303 / SMP-2) TaxID=502025 RepID=D0LUD4_HALO1|nr:hypothetical protein [Haliangium ochraceum]ACY19257.1 hypothetical protein Hoch_6793 [Haliangium ochraceum DSM 14365]
MNARKTWLLAAVAAAIAVVAVVLLLPRQPDSASGAAAANYDDVVPQRPEAPPVEGRDTPRRAPMPSLPPRSAEIQAQAYAQAQADGVERPGETAFRATIDAFMKYNQRFAEQQAAEEGITVPEVAELTYFGFMVLQSQQWPEIEDLVGRSIDEEERALAEQLMHDLNAEFKRGLRDLVDDEAPEAERWALIEKTQQQYKREYFAITGMNETLLDDLLAGDISRTGAPIATPPPEDIEPAPAPEPVQERPQSR